MLDRCAENGDQDGAIPACQRASFTVMESEWTYCYRIRPYYRNVGFGGAAFFLFMGVASTLFAALNADGSFRHPGLAALLFGVFWSFLFLLGVWTLLVYYRYRLFTNDHAIRQIGVIRDDHVELDWVDELQWRRVPVGGSVRVSGVFGVVKIELNNFSSADRERLISYLRGAVAETRQTGWDEFRALFSDSPEKRRRRQRVRVLLFLVLVAHAVAFAVVGALGRDVKYLVLSVINALAAAYLFWELRRARGRH
ncbi:MAG: hypothetical protein JW809_15915 [Pirellulales bacterium]|nr:hypothetical protein [Pirellulales bacterium]